MDHLALARHCVPELWLTELTHASSGKTKIITSASFNIITISYRVIGSELVQKYVGEGARMVRELFEMARTKKACLIFFDEIDAVGGAR